MKILDNKVIILASTLLILFSISNISFSNSLDIKLLMIDDTGCPFCELWDEEIGSKYSKTEEGKLAPLIRHHYGSKLPDQIILNSEPIFTPTFILLEENREKFRFEGYLGEEFFWSFLSEYLQKLKNKKNKD